MKHMTRLALLLICGLSSAQSRPVAACHSASLTAELSGGQAFERAVGGGLAFRLQPQKLGPDGQADGWSISLSPQNAPEQDYIYPVNPPLRFNPLQILGRNYNDDAKASLGRPRRMRFLLNRNDFQQIEPLLNAALWPYSAPHPDTAGDEYLTALSKLRTGVAEVEILNYDLAPEGDSIRRMKFRVTFTAPMNFQFFKNLPSRSSSCPEKE
jgi:hypothetical protein